MPAPHHRLLVVDDEPDLRTLYEITLVRDGYEVECAGSVAQAWERLREGGFHAVVTDMRLPDGSGLDLLRRIVQSGAALRTVVITAYGSAENAVQALKAGAFDYLTKPVDLAQFRRVIASAVGRPGLRGAARPSTTPGVRPPAFAGDAPATRRMVGESAGMRRVRELVGRVAGSMAPVLVTGESGTGKELVARAIHESSPRAAMPFVAVNCGAIPDTLLEAEFFGVRRGAYTGAVEDREGFFQAARGGTLFLDEIGDLPLAMQGKLLRVIQERVARPVGATAEAPVDVRLVSATHRDLPTLARQGGFRQDLYYRLDVIRIEVPALRERLDDLPLLCAALLGRIAREAGLGAAPSIDAPALAWLARHAFPGNVRELENILHRALALASGSVLGLDDFQEADVRMHDLHAGLTRPWPAVSAPDGRAEGSSEVTAVPSPEPIAPAAYPVRADRPLPDPLPSDLARHLDEVERAILEQALRQHRFNRTAAGASLGLSLRQIRYRMARLGIQAGDDPASDGPGAE